MILITGSMLLMAVIVVAVIVVAVIAVALIFLAVVIFGSRRGRDEHPGGGAR